MINRSKIPARLRFLRFFDRPEIGCWPWKGCKNKQGYGTFGDDEMKIVKAHRFAWELEGGRIPDGMVVCHTCDNPPCVRISHLFLGTHQDNVDDKIGKGRHAYGIKCAQAKLTKEQVLMI